MKEQLITFETAKLAKEKKFDLPCHSYYFEDSEFKEFEINDTYGYYGDEYTVNRDEFYNNWNDKWKTTKEGDKCFGCDNKPRYLETFSAPTQSSLQKWLREVHSVEINIIRLKNSYMFFIFKNYKDPISKKGFKNYEEALEEALKEGLRLIK